MVVTGLVLTALGTVPFAWADTAFWWATGLTALTFCLRYSSPRSKTKGKPKQDQQKVTA